MSTVDIPIMTIIVKYQCGCEIPKMTKSVVCGQRIEVTYITLESSFHTYNRHSDFISQD